MIKLITHVTILFFVCMTSCKQCKECYFIETLKGNSTETAIGEFCDEKIEEQENKQFIPVEGTAHIECRK